MAFTDKKTRRRLQSIDLLKLALVVITFSGIYLFVMVHDIENRFIAADLSLPKNFEPKLQWNDSYLEGMGKTLDTLDHFERDDAFQDLFNFDSDNAEQIKPSSKPTFQRKSNFRKRRSVVRSVRDSKTKIQFDGGRNLDSRNGSVYQLDSQRQSAPIDSRSVSVNLRKSSDSERQPETMKSINDHPPTSLGKELQSSKLHSPNLQMESEETEQQFQLPVDLINYQTTLLENPLNWLQDEKTPMKGKIREPNIEKIPSSSQIKNSSSDTNLTSTNEVDHGKLQENLNDASLENNHNLDSKDKTSRKTKYDDNNSELETLNSHQNVTFNKSQKVIPNYEQDSSKVALNHQGQPQPKITDNKQHSDSLTNTSSEEARSSSDQDSSKTASNHQGKPPPKITDNKQHFDLLPKTSSEKARSNSYQDSSKTASNHQSKTPPKITDNKQHSNSLPKTSSEKARSNSEQDSSKTASNHQSKAPPKITDNKQHSDPLPKTSSEKRKSLLIFGDDRSGTTFLTKMFAADPQMFTVYEPLWVTKRWFSQLYISDRKKMQFTRDVVNALLSCQFTRSRAGKEFLSETSSSWVGDRVFQKNAFRTDAFKKKTKSGETLWPDLYENPEFAEEVCLNKFKHSVVKVGQVRVPQASIGVFIPDVFVANPDTDIRIIHIVRDPRGSINSRIKAGWISDFTFTGFPAQVEKVCGKITENIKFGRSIETAWIKERYMEINYKEITRMPITTAKKIYKFAGFEMPDSLIDWIVQSTNPDEKELKQALNNPFSHVRDARKNYLKWRSESPIKRVRIIEKVCKDLLDLLGLEAVADEMEVLCP